VGYVTPGAAPGANGRQGLTLVAAILAFLAVPLILLACALPVLSFSVNGHTQSASLFNPGPGLASELWFVVEPVAVAALGIVGGVLLIIWRSGWRATVVAGMLTASGVQTLFLFLGDALGYDGGGSHPGPGGAVGMVAGALMAAGGIMGIVILRARGQGENPAPGVTSSPASGGTATAPYPGAYPYPGSYPSP
jgi:hypothetical protein